MRIRTMPGFAALLFLIFLTPASAMTVDVARVDTTLIVSDLPPGADVQFILNKGVPVFAKADSAGTAWYLPLFEGSLEIIVRQNGVVIANQIIPVLPATTTTPAPNATAAPVATAASRPGTGGGGGGGMTTSEPFENIEKTERIEKSLISNIPITYNFTVPGIYQIVVTGTENENLINIKVEVLKGPSKLVKAAPSGTVYKSLNVWAGTKRIKKAVIRFRVENSWMQGNNLAASDMKMLRWDGDKWVQIETKEMSKDSTYASFEAATDVLSNFAISGLRGETKPTVQAAGVTQTAARPETTVQAAVPTPKATGFEIVLAIAGLCILYIFRRK